MSRTARGAAITREQLLASAARCYDGAGKDLDACRCLQAVGEHAGAALLHERAGRWHAAAAAFELAARWVSAARCHLEAAQPLEAARCLDAAGEPLEAAWVLAHHAGRTALALAALTGVTATGAETALGLLVVQARCAWPREPAAAARLLRQVNARLGEMRSTRGRDLVMNWAWTLSSEVMDRPDLTTELLASGWQAGIDTRQRWERWAAQRLGSSEAVALMIGNDDDDDAGATRRDRAVAP